MSLNWKEIDLVLSELDLAHASIQNVVQPDFNSLYLELYRDGQSSWLFICLQAGMTRLHLSSAPQRTKGQQLRFCEFLRSHIKGGQLLAISQIGHDRIVEMTIASPEGPLKLYLRLWSNAANILAVDAQGLILDAFYRRPQKLEISGQAWHLPIQSNGFNAHSDSRFQIRKWPQDFSGGFNRYLEQNYRETSRIQDFAELKGRLERQCLSQIERYGARKIKLLRQIEQAANPQRFRQMGEIILSFKHAIQRGASWFETDDWFSPGSTIRIELDPRLDAAANAERYFQKFQKARDGAAFIENDLGQVSTALQALDLLRHDLNIASDFKQLQICDDRLAIYLESGTVRKAGLASDRPGLSYVSHEFLLLIGRNAAENDELLRHHVRGNDYWLHVRDFSGGYVFIKVPRNKTVPLEVLVDASHLAVWYSKAKGEPEVDLFYTQVKYLRRAKHGTYGMVVPTRERNLHVRIDSDRVNHLQSLLNAPPQ